MHADRYARHEAEMLELGLGLINLYPREDRDGGVMWDEVGPRAPGGHKDRGNQKHDPGDLPPASAPGVIYSRDRLRRGDVDGLGGSRLGVRGDLGHVAYQ